MSETNDWQCENCDYMIEVSGTALNQVAHLEDVVKEENNGELCCSNPDYSPA